jgi:hypothetical protein
MKKIFTLFITTICIIKFYAINFQVDGIYYNTINENEVGVAYGAPSTVFPNTYTGDIVIPAIVTYNDTTYNVTSIEDYAFYQCTGLTSITIPASIKSIGDMAFFGCSALNKTIYTGDIANWCAIKFITFTANPINYSQNLYINNQELKDLVIPNTVESIGDFAFFGFTTLSSISIPTSVKNIGSGALAHCSGLTSITIPSSVTNIGDGVLYGSIGLTSIVVESGNTIYDSRNNCNAIIETANNKLISGCRNTIIPNNIECIGSSAFRDYSNLTSIAIPTSVKSIEYSAFRDCKNLTSISIPTNVMSIGNIAFAGCDSLTSIVVESGNTVYDSRNNCNAIIETKTNSLVVGCSKTIIPNDVEIIGYGAFSYLSSLTSISIPSSVKSIGYMAFRDCTALSEVKMSNGITTIEDYAFGYCTSLTSISLPESVTSLGIGAFGECSALSSITLSNNIKEIKYQTFMYCSSLEEITLPNSITMIDIYAFYYCTNLRSLTVPNGTTSIGDGALAYCYALTSISLPASMTSLGDGALADCSSLDSIICDAVTPPALEPETFYNLTPSDITLSVPSESVNTYKTTTIWQDFNIQAKNDIVNNIENIGLDNEDCTNKTYKVFRNGQLVIIRNGVEYNAAGIKL